MDLFAEPLLGGYDDERLFRLLGDLSTFEGVFDEAERRAKDPSSSDRVRARALDIVGKLRPACPESISFAKAGLSESSGLVVRAAAWALVHLGGDEATEALMTSSQSLDVCVRLAVATGVGASVVSGAEETLIGLTDDEDEEVRNWATFGLGQMGVLLARADSPQVLSALSRRLGDLNPEVKNEALWGLALREDREALVQLLKRLHSDAWVQGDEDVAVDILHVEGEYAVESLRLGLASLIEFGDAS